jgi:phosphoribosylpyrophosphate synthetase
VLNNHKLKVFTGRANPALAEQIAHCLGDALGKITLGNFPDGETPSASRRTSAAATSSSSNPPTRRSTKTSWSC